MVHLQLEQSMEELERSLHRQLSGSPMERLMEQALIASSRLWHTRIMNIMSSLYVDLLLFIHIIIIAVKAKT